MTDADLVIAILSGNMANLNGTIVRVDAFTIFEFYTSPQWLQDLCNCGGDEDWIAVVPPSLSQPIWMEEGTLFGCCTVREIDFREGWKLYVGCHA